MLEIIIKFTSYFLIYSFLGWMLESVYKSIIGKKFVNSGFIHGPFCAIYGFGAIIMLFFLESFKNNPIKLFIIGFILLSIWEYIVSCFLEKVFHTKYWDYSHKKINIKGRVCLENSIYWGVLGVIFTNFIHPFVIKLIDNISNSPIIYINIIIAIYLISDTVVSIIETNNVNIRIKSLEEITERLKERLEEFNTVNNEKAEAIINDLKLKQIELKVKIHKRITRVRKAFPTMKSEKMINFLNEKMEKMKLKNKEK